jgi:hypothetical protein
MTPPYGGLQHWLLRGRNADGGWGYYPGKATRLEPTCWAMLALKGLASDADLVPVLTRWPVRDGLLTERAGGDPNYAFHALGLLVLQAFGAEHASANRTLLTALEDVKGVRITTRNTRNRQNNQLQGWSWVPATFSWVEPTAWALLTLKKYGRRAQEDMARIAEAEALLLDRACVVGGWNYGNSNVLGQELHPYVPTTASAVLALQGRETEPAVARGLEFLEHRAFSEPSGFALALAAIALRVMNRSFSAALDLLVRRLPTTCALGNQLGAALSLYALRTDHGDAAFRI